MRDKNETFGFKADNHIKFRIPWNIANDDKRCVLRKDELRLLQEKCLEKCRRGFVSKYYPVVSGTYSVSDVEQIAYVFFKASINRYDPSKIKHKNLAYKRPEKGLFGKYPMKKQAEVERQKKNLVRWFEVYYFRYINTFLSEVKQEAAKKGGPAYNFSDDFIERWISKNKEQVSPKQALLRRVLGDLKKYKGFIRFFIDLSKRETPTLMKNKYKSSYALFLQLADDIQYEISQATNEETWNNDVYFENVKPYEAPEYELFAGDKSIPLDTLRNKYWGSVLDLEHGLGEKVCFKVNGENVSKAEERNFALIELVETFKNQISSIVEAP